MRHADYIAAGGEGADIKDGRGTGGAAGENQLVAIVVGVTVDAAQHPTAVFCLCDFRPTNPRQTISAYLLSAVVCIIKNVFLLSLKGRGDESIISKF